MNPIQIIPYAPEHQPYFERFNRRWIEEMFTMEPPDEWVLQHPEEAILQPGGAILMATYEGTIAGTVALRRLDDTRVEFTKMAVDPSFRRRGIAAMLCYASFAKAAELGAKQVVLYSNTRNAGAIRLYEMVGFRHVTPEQDLYRRANVKMLIDISEELTARAVSFSNQQIIPA